ncbi:hypothetical protein HU200_057685 [Digitaria exilis]|uniref:non-specific serine/threonine protein kinase n=1 Tax=Digitaria exilis TaxID=1010633 RepID=A0A835AEE4_9POAL|nr:hypothetical protein HU200_057685 [Digitaria exilis]
MAAPKTKFLNLPLLLFFPILLLFHRASGARSISPDTLNTGGNITHGETLVSANGTFTLGFFSPAGITTKKYLGIWFTAAGADAVHWVANGDTPLNGNTSGVLVLSSGGSLLLLDGSAGQIAWSSLNTTTSAAAASTVAQLLDSGNLVVREQSTSGGRVLWQSFDHPTNTMLAGMKFGKNLKTGEEWSLTSWRAANDPATGSYRRVMDTTTNLPDVVTWQGHVKRYRAGPWNGRLFSGEPDMDSQYKLFSVDMVDDADEVAYVLNAVPGVPFFTHFVLDEDGKVQVFLWETTTRSWNSFSWSPRDDCDDYAMCGAFGLCGVGAGAASTAECTCVDGFSPASPAKWVLEGVKLPDTDNATVDMSATLEQCRARCLANCSCVAYAPADISGDGGGSGCVMWRDNILDVRYVENGQDLYVRLAKSETGTRKNVAKIVLPVLVSVLVLTAAGMYLVWICKLRGKRRNRDILRKAILGYSTAPNELGDENIELPFVSFGEIAAATNNFSEDNMLGQGGFGKVYKDSRLTIIHRDLKPSNILLDADMSPKISDFGMARIFGGNQQEANTNRVVGTYGYMSPGYAMDGAFSVKSDTYSFGVIVLEIISGLKITLTHYKGFPNVLAYLSAK